MQRNILFALAAAVMATSVPLPAEAQTLDRVLRVITGPPRSYHQQIRRQERDRLEAEDTVMRISMMRTREIAECRYSGSEKCVRTSPDFPSELQVDMVDAMDACLDGSPSACADYDQMRRMPPAGGHETDEVPAE